MKEEYKSIDGFENYEVSNLGNVRNKKTGKMLNPGVNKSGYLYVGLCENHKRKNKYVHRLVAQAFLLNSNNCQEVNHKDENKTNNSVKNLEWCTRKYNINYGTRAERMAKSMSKEVFQFNLDGKLIRKWSSLHEIHRELGYGPGNISNCCNGKFKTRYGFVWRYNYKINRYE